MATLAIIKESNGQYMAYTVKPINHYTRSEYKALVGMASAIANGKGGICIFDNYGNGGFMFVRDRSNGQGHVEWKSYRSILKTDARNMAFDYRVQLKYSGKAEAHKIYLAAKGAN